MNTWTVNPLYPHHDRSSIPLVVEHVESETVCPPDPFLYRAGYLDL